MRALQIVQATTSGVAAFIITFLQPWRDQIGVLVIGTWALLLLAIGYAVAAGIKAKIQKSKMGWALFFITFSALSIFAFLCLTQFERMAQRVNPAEPLPAGAFNTFDLNEFAVLTFLFLGINGLVQLTSAIVNRLIKPVRDNLISAGIFLGAIALVLALPGDAVYFVGVLNTACIFTAVHLGIAAASPKA